MSQTNVNFSIALILACVFMVIAPGSAAEPSTEFTALFGQDPDVLQCLSTLQSVQGCVQEITTSFLSHQVQLLGTACCKALNEVDDRFCWPKVFPFDPFFPPLLNNYCAAVVSGRGVMKESDEIDDDHDGGGCSKDNNIGEYWLAVGQTISWSFRENAFSTTLYHCYAQWGNKIKRFNAYEYQGTTKNCCADKGIITWNLQESHIRAVVTYPGKPGAELLSTLYWG
ncbi:hypothetical protein EZV62_013278 [Acer yangbiense]|uniref:Prolamin-like domain-containing protein n=1 Tax=Acer yangbiense TaxID=1000413 RepID=A0A5C7HYI1_9ROSI|nr:hypothetical protein EZV62_013278 [Acer yangbiense]